MARPAPPEQHPEPARPRPPLFAGTPLVVFVGQGGVGKTTCAAAAALAEARAGRRVLVASIDPAHSLGDALDRPLGEEPTRVDVAGSSTLFACEVDAARAYARWLARHRAHLREVLTRGTWFGERELEPLLDLVPAGLSELMALHELERFVADARFERVFVDPSPTGHLPRLIEAPALLGRLAETLGALNAKHRLLARSLVGADVEDATELAIDELAREAARLDAWIRDPARCSFVWVVTPEPLALAGTLASAAGLEALGPRAAAVVLQRDVPRAPLRDACARCRARALASRTLEVEIRARLARGGAVPFLRVPELAREPRGERLLAVARALERPPRARSRLPPRAAPGAGSRTQPGAHPDARANAHPTERAPAWVAHVAPPRLRLLVVAGKGGVGKSTCAAALALELARTRPVLLMSVDPAHSLAELLGTQPGDEARVVAPGPGAATSLCVRELDAARAFERRRAAWKRSVDEAFAERLGARLDARFDREALSHLLDLAPPGVDELGALLALVDELGLGPEAPPSERLVVLDTPATGHALELFALPERALAWVHSLLSLLLAQPEELRPSGLARELLDAAHALRATSDVLHDPERTRCAVVSLAAELPRRETARLAEGLERLGIDVRALIVNRSAAVASDGTCPRCRRAARAEAAGLSALRRSLPPRIRRGSVTIFAPETSPAPHGPQSIAAWARTWRAQPTR